jgi:hypothetical protein
MRELDIDDFRFFELMGKLAWTVFNAYDNRFRT